MRFFERAAENELIIAVAELRYRLVAGAAELGGSVADRGACNNAVRGIRRVSGISGWRDGVFIRWRVAAERRAGCRPS